MPIVLIATTNPGKLREYRRLFEDVPESRVVSPNDLEVWVEVAETGETLEENALLKARALYEAMPDTLRREGVGVLGDDSGLEVDALGGAPGVYSNRWAGPNTTPTQRNELLLERLRDVPDEQRTARFRCAIALVSPDGQEYMVDGAVEGQIAHDLRGSGGFGYDPLFELPDGKRMAELSPDEKNIISHRGVAGAKAARLVLEETDRSGR
jgi:XTP/dITP diphosphohydrolase